MSKTLSLQLELSFQRQLADKVTTVLDDIEFEHCAAGDVPEDSNQLSCNFDHENTCSWYNDYTASMLWETERDSNGEFDHFHLILYLISSNSLYNIFNLLWNIFLFSYMRTSSAGFYMHIVASEKLNISSTARLMSFPRPVGQLICVSFWYRIFGNSIGMWLKSQKTLTAILHFFGPWGATSLSVIVLSHMQDH